MFNFYRLLTITIFALTSVFSYAAEKSSSEGDSKAAGERVEISGGTEAARIVGRVPVVPQKSTGTVADQSWNNGEFSRFLEVYSKAYGKLLTYENVRNEEVVRVHYHSPEQNSSVSFEDFSTMIELHDFRKPKKKNDGDLIQIPDIHGKLHQFKIDQSPFPDDGNAISVISYMQNANWFSLTLGTLDPEKIPAAFALLPNGDVDEEEKDRLRKHLDIAYCGKLFLPESTKTRKIKKNVSFASPESTDDPKKPDAGDSKNNGTATS